MSKLTLYLTKFEYGSMRSYKYNNANKFFLIVQIVQIQKNQNWIYTSKQ